MSVESGTNVFVPYVLMPDGGIIFCDHFLYGVNITEALVAERFHNVVSGDGSTSLGTSNFSIARSLAFGVGDTTTITLFWPN